MFVYMFFFVVFVLQMVSICQSGKAKKLVETSDHILRAVHPRVREANSVSE